ncbi:MAG: hemerythrin domain-containing protein [Candidatus Omnitrophota bacterium]
MKPRVFSYCKSGWNLHMMPIGYLMIEHRLIERMIRLLSGGLKKIEKNKRADLKLIDIAVDFIRTYADKCHHGKEEDILFRDLIKKGISPEHRKAVKELIEEHKIGRTNVAKLIEARNEYENGVPRSLKDIKRHIKWLIEFYPKHIVKEDRQYFIPFMSYFDKKEQDEMLGEFCEFDNSPIQETYRNIVQKLESNKS